MKRRIALLVLAALALSLTACTGIVSSGNTPTADESPVPEGMPVMYEFFTTS